MKPAYYNEIDPYPAQWLRNLIAVGHIPAGDVDERDIREVQPDDLRGYGQCHFFAGIAGWPYALRLAGWPDDEPVWTGSCPCQPLSSAGQRKGHADERHLWPAFHALIAECKPATVFGEQVASKDGREWLAGVRADLEHLGYAVGSADMPAAGVGAPHIRQRLWWVADAANGRRREGQSTTGKTRPPESRSESPEQLQGRFERRSSNGGLADADGRDAGAERQQCGGEHRQQPQDSGFAGGLGDAPGARLQGTGGQQSQRGARGIGQPRPSGGHGFWNAASQIPCGDGKARRVGTGIQPLAHGVSARVGKLRAAGNAIVPQVAAEFIKAARDA